MVRLKGILVMGTQFIFCYFKILSENSCVQLKLEFETDSTITQEHIVEATKIGINFGKPALPLEPTKYFCFLPKLSTSKRKDK